MLDYDLEIYCYDTNHKDFCNVQVVSPENYDLITNEVCEPSPATSFIDTDSLILTEI